MNRFSGIFVLLLSSLLFISSVGSSDIELEVGKNVVVFEKISPFYVSTLVKLNPDLEAVSYIQNNKTIGYINFIGGMGEDFVIKEGISYELISREKIPIVLP